MPSKWIDVKEKMPEPKQWCWVWFEYENENGDGYCIKLFLNTAGKWMKNTLSVIKDEYVECIKAWQPYYEPEPYKKEGNVK